MIDKNNIILISKKIEGIDTVLDKYCKNPTWENMPILQAFFGNTYVNCRNSQESLIAQLEAMDITLNTKTDWAPYLEPWHGVGVYAEAFGCPYIWKEKNSPWTKPIIHTFEDLKKIKNPGWKKGEITNLVLNSIRYFRKETRDLIPISLTDTQSPLSNALLICESNLFFETCYGNPEIIHKFLDKITDLIIDFSLEQRKEIGNNLASPGHSGTFSRPWSRSCGIGLSDDFLVTVSPKFYEEFARPYNERIAAALGGVVIHSCGTWGNEIINTILKTKGLIGIELAVSDMGASSLDLLTGIGDPSPNLPDMIRENLKNTGVTVKARIGGNPLEVIEKIYDKDLLFLPEIIWTGSILERNKNYELIHEKILDLIEKH